MIADTIRKGKTHFDVFTQEVTPGLERMFCLLDQSTIPERNDRFHALDRPGLKVLHRRAESTRQGMVRIQAPDTQPIDIERHWVGEKTKYSLGGLVRPSGETGRGGQFMVLALGIPIDNQRDSLREGWWDAFGHAPFAVECALRAIERQTPVRADMSWAEQFKQRLKACSAHNLETAEFTHWVNHWTPGPMSDALSVVSALVDPDTNFYEWKADVLQAWQSLEEEKPSCEGLLEGLLDS